MYLGLHSFRVLIPLSIKISCLLKLLILVFLIVLFHQFLGQGLTEFIWHALHDVAYMGCDIAEYSVHGNMKECGLVRRNVHLLCQLLQLRSQLFPLPLLYDQLNTCRLT